MQLLRAKQQQKADGMQHSSRHAVTAAASKLYCRAYLQRHHTHSCHGNPGSKIQRHICWLELLTGSTDFKSYSWRDWSVQEASPEDQREARVNPTGCVGQDLTVPHSRSKGNPENSYCSAYRHFSPSFNHLHPWMYQIDLSSQYP